MPSETAKLCLLIVKNFTSVMLDSKFYLELEDLQVGSILKRYFKSLKQTQAVQFVSYLQQIYGEGDHGLKFYQAKK